ncbi:MAG: hypothetical protein ACR2FO_04365 [Actinomycetota bacterium]
MYRFLLDEHMKPFPGLPLDLFGFEIVRLGDFDRSFVNTATPDWILYLAAAARGFTGLITHDKSQVTQENEVRSLELTGIAVVTYHKGVNDELTKWGLLMAHSPRIVAALKRPERGAFVLPTPGPVKVSPPGALLRQIEAREKVGSQEVRGRADVAIKNELSRRRLSHLWPESKK